MKREKLLWENEFLPKNKMFFTMRSCSCRYFAIIKRETSNKAFITPKETNIHLSTGMREIAS